MLTVLIILAAFAQLLVSLFVFVRGRRSLSYQLFFLIGIASMCWAITNYLTVVLLNSENLIYIVRFILFFVVLQNTAFYMFARTFPEQHWKFSKKWLTLYLFYSIFTASLTLSPFVFTNVGIKDGLAVTQAGPGILAFIIHASFSIGVAFKSLARKLKNSKGIQKNQLQILMFASFLVWVVVPLTNFVITPIFKTTFFIVVSPIYTLLFASIIAYAIVAQKLFDIKAIVARSVSYVLSLGSVALFYAGLSSLIQDKLLSQLSSQVLNVGVNAVFFLIAVALYPHITAFFNKVTNKIFFQDAYEPQKFLDELNEVLVVNIELEKLLTETIYVIQQNLKTSYCIFTIRETSYFPRRIVGDPGEKFTADSIEEIVSAHGHLREKVIVADYLEDENKELKKVLDKNDVVVLVRLVATLDYEIQGVGHILFGAKKSGNPYNKQDIQILEIIANELVIAVQNGLRFEEIEKFNATLQDKIDEATRQLRKTNEKLKALDETKDEFISMASHQLRTPLTSVKGYLSMVLEGDAGETNEMQHKLLNQAFISSQRMVYLIADLLNVSRLRTGKFVIDAVATNLADLVEGELGQLTETAKSHKLELTYKKPENFPVLMLDETKVRQVVMNFADNAIYYTPSGGHIKVEVEDKGQTVEFRVVDDGLGVPKTEQHHLFTKFYRAGNAKKARPDGTGLGLFMAKKVVAAQGGAIIFRSEEGKGSTFGFSFEKAKLQVPSESEKEKS